MIMAHGIRLYPVLLLALYLLCLPLLCAETSQASLQPQKIIVAAGESSSPFYSRGKDGKAEGWVIDLWRLWSKKTGIEVEFSLDTFGNSLKLLREGKADAHAGCFYSKSRDEYIEYVLPLVEVQTHFFYSTNVQGLKSLQDLRGFAIGIIKGDYAQEVIGRELPGAALVLFEDNKELFDAIENGDIKVFVKDTLIGLKMLRERGLSDQFSHIPDQPLYSKPFQVAVREGQSGLADLILNGMQQITQEEKAKIEETWTGKARAGVGDKLVIACMYDYPPFTSLTKSGKAAGLLVDLWRLWAERTETSIEFRFGYWYETLDDIAQGRADIHSGLNKNYVREAWMDFSEPIFLTDTSLFYHAGQPSLALEELKGKKVGVIKESILEAWLKEKHPQVECIPFTNNERMVGSLMEGDVIAVLSEGVNFSEVITHYGAAAKIIRKKEALDFRNIYSGTMAGRKALIKKINQGFQAISREEIKELERRWVPEASLRHYANQPKPIELTLREKIWLKEHTKVHLGVDSRRPPFEFISPDGLYEGIVSEYVATLGKQLGIEVLPVFEKDWTNMADKIASQEVDMVAGPHAGEPLSEYLHYTRPYLSFPLVILTRNDSTLLHLRDLKGINVGIIKGYEVEEALKRDVPGVAVTLVDSMEEGLQRLADGKLDALISSTVSYRYMTSKLGITDIRVAMPTPYSFDISMGVRRDWPELSGILDKALGTITDDKRDEIINHWLNVHIERFIDWTMVWQVALGILTIAGLILGIIIHANRKLSAEIVIRKQAEAALAKSRKKLKDQNQELIEAAELREDVERVTRHDLKNPLTNILSVPQLLMMADNIEEYQKDMLKRLEEAGYAMLNMINNSLDLFKMERGTYKLVPVDVDIAAVVRKVMQDQESISSSKEMVTSILINGKPAAQHASLIVQGEELLCYSMLSNLIRNALDASPEGEQFTVDLHQEDGVTVSMHNMGAVPEDIRDHFFEKYATSGKARGTGLGTYSAKLIAEVHGGSIDFSTSEEDGTTVSVRLPR